MLEENKINFPITFNNCAVGGGITFYNSVSSGVWYNGSESALSLSCFIKLHNEHNPNNKADEKYNYTMKEKKAMLKVDEIIYPITFDSYGVGKFKFTSRNNGFKTDIHGREVKYNGSVDYFVFQNNLLNPGNSPDGDYYYKMAENKERKDTIDSIRYFFGNAGTVSFNDAAFTDSVGDKDYDYICDVELMPVGAILVGIQRECGEWGELKFKPRRIEVHDETIKLLSDCAGGYKDGNNYSGEINIKRGTKVKIKNSTKVKIKNSTNC